VRLATGCVQPTVDAVVAVPSARTRVGKDSAFGPMAGPPDRIQALANDSAIGSLPPQSVAIVDNQPITRSGLEQLAATIPGLIVTASVASVDELDLSAAAYDMVVMDVPAQEDGLSLKAITRMAEVSRPLIISNWDRPPSLLAAVRAGARGCVTRQSNHLAVAYALNVVAAGGFYLCEQLVHQFHLELNRPPRADPHGLAPREVETLQWIARGYTHGQIATRMGLSQATINTYAKRIRGKLKVNNKAELTRMAIDLGHFGEHHLDHSAA
jgi:DNA-binding NarL/FixJ family response regulator